ncbi:hypothetical protein LTR24_007287 [Lithohypha guttulata]|uniref:Uncharacterized protein n=1 Tax=Lithohypha guttulata TaxID=1690604 RepID=A0ABR0K3H2_9EURO|nr:hypothetical protein LTR24_007287 [Lithohypha guttulata]
MTSNVNDTPTGNPSTTKSIQPQSLNAGSNCDSPPQAAVDAITSPGSPRVCREVEIVLQLGSFIRFADGRIKLVEGRLFRNIEGLPLPLHKITTIKELISVQNRFFPATYLAHGLDPNHIGAWYVFLRPADEKARTHGPLTNEQEWSAEVKTLSETVNKPCKAHKLPKCALCQAPPIIIACFNDMHLQNGLATRGLAPGTKIDFLDYHSAALADIYMSASDTLRQSIASLQREVRGKPFRALTTPYSLPAYNGDEYIGSLVLSAPRSLGLVPGATLTASAQITLPSQGPAPAQVQHFSAQVGRRQDQSVLEVSRTQATTLPFRADRAAAHQRGPGLVPDQPYGAAPQAGGGATNSNGKRSAAKSTSGDQQKTSPSEKPTKKPR